MTELLATLLDANAFLPSSLVADLVACHVPFDELIEGARVESALDAYAHRDLAVALIGPSGCGKSGVASHVFGRLGTDFASIHAPVFFETEQTMREPGTFARYLLQKLLDVAEPLAAITAGDRERLLVSASEQLSTPTRAIGHSAGAGLDLWLLRGDVAREVTETIRGAELAGSTDRVLEAIDRVIEAIRASGLTPIVFIDDTDRWLQVGDIDRTPLVAGFFGTIVRMLAERGCGLVVAVHESYLELPAYRAGTRGFLTDSVVIPRLPTVESLVAVVDRRVSLQVDGVAATDVVEAAALERLFHYYGGVLTGSLRNCLLALHLALSAAEAAGAETVGLGAIDDAVASQF